jgi:hypothetical protein
MHPDTRICPQLKSCTVTDSWLRDSLYPRFRFASAGHGAILRQCPQPNLYPGINSRLRLNLYPRFHFVQTGRGATRVMLNKICTWTAKTRAIPSLHRDSFLAKVPGPCPVLASGNTTSPYCRAVRRHKRLTGNKL